MFSLEGEGSNIPDSYTTPGGALVENPARYLTRVGQGKKPFAPKPEIMAWMQFNIMAADEYRAKAKLIGERGQEDRE